MRQKHFMNDYLKRILKSRVYDIAEETPLELATNLSRRYKNNIFLKREDLQSVFSFKLRGAYNMMSQLSIASLNKGVVTSSAGNHAQGVALSAFHLKCNAIIVMPVTTPEVKINAVKNHKCEVVLFGENYDESYKEALRISKEKGLTFIHPFDDPDVIAGQGTIGMEILRQSKKIPDKIYVAVGGGGLIGGMAAYIKDLCPEIEVIGVEPEDSNAMTKSLEAGERITLKNIGLFADGVAVKRVGKNTFELAQKYVDRMITVTNDEICAAIKDVFEDTRSILEPAGALAIAGLKADINNRNLKGRDLVAVACGANMNFDRLRFVAERAELGEERESMLAVEIPEKAGSLKKLCAVIASRNLTEFSYRMSNSSKAQIFMGVEVKDKSDRNKFIELLNLKGFKCIDLSENELAKMHLRHMVGGRLTNNPITHGKDSTKELIYRFEFPEKPGALMEFLEALYPEWSISIFHYRNHGSDIGRIVIGVLVDQSKINEWESFVENIGYPSFNERENPAYKLFLGAECE